MPKSLPYRPRVQIIGTLSWLCPAFGKINRAHLTPTAGWKLRCKGRLCGAVFVHGSTFWQLPGGRAQQKPLDLSIPDPFPLAETDQLDRGRYINSAVPCDDETDSKRLLDSSECDAK